MEDRSGSMKFNIHREQYHGISASKFITNAKIVTGSGENSYLKKMKSVNVRNESLISHLKM